MVVDRHQTDLYVRPSWLDAAIALRQIEKGNAKGNRSALWFRCRLQKQLFQLGCFVQRHAGKVIFVAVLVLATFCVGLKSAITHYRADQLWIEEGGRLERELKYVEAALGESTSYTHQLVIQIPKDTSTSLLDKDALLTHLNVLQSAISVTVNLFQVEWKFKDICYSQNLDINDHDSPYITNILSNIIPCTIVTPLDCFWEGSKLMGPSAPISIPFHNTSEKIKWTSLNPKNLLAKYKSPNNAYILETLEQIMKRAGITTGYQEKPCLNPKDPDCPNTAPNKNSTAQDKLNIWAQLTGGCYGFAPKYMHWPEALIVGGAKRNKTNHIQTAHALQTILQLMSEQELYDINVNDYRIHHVDWTPQKAALVLEAWQKKFSHEIRKKLTADTDSVAKYNIYSFSTATLNDVLSHFSKVHFTEIVIGYLAMLSYVALYLFKWKDPILSQTVVGVAGVVLLIVTVAAALGVCAVFGIAFNASTTQIVPFLALGLGIIEMFLLTSAYANQSPTEGHLQKMTGNVLKRGGLSVLLTSLSIVSAFAAATIIPIPALRVFCIQAGISVFFNLVTLLLVFPAIISIDLRRRRSGRVDIFCCCCVMPDNGNWPCLENSPSINRKFPANGKKQAITCALPPDRQQTITVLVAPPLPAATPMPTNKRDNYRTLRNSLLATDIEKAVDVNDDDNNDEDRMESGKINRGRADDEQRRYDQRKSGQIVLAVWSIDYLIERYVQFLCRRLVKVLTVLSFVAILVVSVWNVTKIVYGLDLSDVVPQKTNEHAFLTAQERYFGFYNMYAITQGDFEYPTNQKLLYEYHEAFTRVPNIFKNDNGGVPQFWLGLMRDWLIGLQNAFDRDWSKGCITQERWFANASEDGILAYKLLVQTGYIENPVDSSLVGPNRRLVDYDGIINKDAFYNYLSAWVYNDPLGYGASQANFKPEPKYWKHDFKEFDLKIPKSSPLIYAQIPFYLQHLNTTAGITKLITQVRELCQRFETRGLPNFPSGIPFQFWEQYQTLWQYLIVAILCALGSIFCLVSLLLLNFWAALVVSLQATAITLQLFGSFTIIGVKLNAVPAVLLVVSVGFSMHFIVHTCYSFLTVIGNKRRRLELAMKHVLPIIFHVITTTLLSTFILAFNEFDFIVRYFFNVLITLVGIGLLNGLLIFPVMLLLIGPPSEVKPTKYPDRIATPSPEPVKRATNRSLSYRHATLPPSRRHREPSLSTITEEPGSWHSTAHEIVMEPELIVETTTCTHAHNSSPADSRRSSNGNDSSSCSSSPISVHRSTTIPSNPSLCSASSSTPLTSTHVTTKVTATAKFKVELHTPIRTTYERSHSTSSGSNNRRNNSGRRRAESTRSSSPSSTNTTTTTTTTTSAECPSKYCSDR